MAEWKLLAEETAKEIWDKQLVKFYDCSPYQTYSWGQYHKALGWEPYYFVAETAQGAISAMFLGFLRRYPLGIGLMWCTGGPIGDLKTWNESLPITVLKATKLKRLYLRFRCDRERDAQTALFLNYQNWTRSIYTMTSNVSMELDLSASETSLFSNLSNKWRRNLNISLKNNLIIKLCQNPNIEEICSVYAEMEARKNLPQQFSFEKLENLFNFSGSNLIFYRCEDASGKLLCFRGCLIAGNRACDYLAATTESGRDLRASYATYWQLLMYCQSQGIRYFDLGGIDPWANPGVYKFKRETGAREIEYLGEWDWASHNWLRLLGNLAIWKKQKIRKVESQFVLNNTGDKHSTNVIEPLVNTDSKNAQLFGKL
jgi:hypothetical protein